MTDTGTTMVRDLVAYEMSQTEERMPDYYALLPVHWVCHVHRENKRPPRFERLVSKPDPEVPVKHPVPSVRRGNAPMAMLLADHGGYVFGVTDDDAKQIRADLYKRTFIKSIEDCYATTAVPALGAVLKAVTKGLKPPEGFLPSERTIFKVDGEIVTDDPKIQEYWKDQQNVRITSEDKRPCSCCGAVARVMRVIPDEVKKVPDSLQGACMLISANTNATWRYGSERTLGASICYDCARDSTRAINRLIADRTRAIQIGNLLVLWWTAHEVFDLKKALLYPSADVLATLTKIGQACLTEQHPVHVLMLSARKTRAVVRDYSVVPVSDLAGQIAKWYDHQGRKDGEERSPLISTSEGKGKARIRRPGLLNLLHPKGEVPKLKVSLLCDVVRSATTGSPMPIAARRTAARTVAIGKRLEPVEMSLLRLAMHYLPQHMERDMTVMNDTPAYRAGRLLAVLERIQMAAIPRINKTVADQALRSASAQPKAVLGRAMIRAQAHLAKLDRHRRGAPYRGALTEALQGLDLPARLVAEDQLAFASGYHEHSARASYTPKEPAKK